MTPPRTESPEIRREAERLATIAVEKPQELRGEIAGKTLDDLHALSNAIEARRLPVNDDVSKAVAERMEQLLQSQTVDKQLEVLQNRLSLAALADIRSPQGEPTLVQKIKRQFFTALSYIESMPTGLMSFIPGLSTVSSFASFMPSFGRRNVTSMDIEDAIAAEKRLGEDITFAPLSATEFTLYDTFVKETVAKGEAPPPIPELVRRHLENVRERNLLAGTPRAAVTVTMNDLLKNPAQEEVAELRTVSNENQLKEAIGLSSVSDVRLGEIAKFENGVLELPSSEVDGTAITPRSRAAVIIDALKNIPNADVLTVVPQGATKVEWIDGKRSLTLSLAHRPKDLSVLQSMIREQPKKISTLSIERNDRMGSDNIRFHYEGNLGVLDVPNDETLLAALSIHLPHLPIGENGRNGEEIYTLKNDGFNLDDPVDMTT